MDSQVEVRTKRLVLRGWRDSDREPLAVLSADPRVMGDLPIPLSRQQSEALIARSRAHFDQHGFGLWAIEVPGRADFIGFAGLWSCSFEAAFSPCVEIGWRLATPYWGCGYGTEVAGAVLRFAFECARLPEVIGLTVGTNHRSRRVMEKLGMRHDPVEVEHPLLPAGDPLSRQVLYRIDRNAWEATVRASRRAASL